MSATDFVIDDLEILTREMDARQWTAEVPRDECGPEPPNELPPAVEKPAEPVAAASESPAAIPAELSPWQQAYGQYLVEHERWQTERADAEHALSQAALKLSAAKEHVKTCREIFDGTTELLLQIEARKPRIPELTAAAGEPAGEEIDASFTVLPPVDWRAAPTSQLDLTGIKGLGPKKLKALYAACPTIGDLEDLRAKGSGKGVGLRSIKGIGEEAAQAIEDKALAWLTEHRDKEIFDAAAAAGQSETKPANEVQESSEGIAANDHDAQRAAAIEIRAGQILHQERLAEEAGEGAEPLEPELENGRWWNGGVEAFDRGLPVRDCPIEPPGHEQDDWIRGWMTAKLDWDARQEAEAPL